MRSLYVTITLKGNPCKPFHCMPHSRPCVSHIYHRSLLSGTLPIPLQLLTQLVSCPPLRLSYIEIIPKKCYQCFAGKPRFGPNSQLQNRVALLALSDDKNHRPSNSRYMNPPPPPAPAMAWSDKGGMQWLHDSADGRLAMLHNRAVRSPDHLDRLGFSPTTVTRQSHKADHGFPVVQVPFGILPGTTPITSRTHYGDLLTLLLRFLVLFLFF